MTAKVVPRAKINDILAFLKGRGVTLTSESIRLLKERLENEPISKPTLERSKSLVKNPLFRDILDAAFTQKSEKMFNTAKNNPILKIIDEKRKETLEGDKEKESPMPPELRKIFYDETKWQPYHHFLGIPSRGQIVKILDAGESGREYIGYIVQENNEIFAYTTHRKVILDELKNSKFMRLKEGVFQYEINEIKEYEKGYYTYIM
ncbi:hypothetical protein ACFL7D_12085, partial [candidate division KSB1 bacterium]